MFKKSSVYSARAGLKACGGSKADVAGDYAFTVWLCGGGDLFYFDM